MFNSNIKFRACLSIFRGVCFFVMFMLMEVTYAQYQNHWICLNGGNGIGNNDSFDMAYDVNFNSEPPTIRVIKGKSEIESSMKNFTFSDINGNLNLYTDQLNGFFNNKNELLNNKIWFIGQGQNFSLMFPTLIDTLKVVIFVEDSLIQKTSSYTNGEIAVKMVVFNTIQKKIVSNTLLVDFRSHSFNPFKWQIGDFNTNCSYQIFKQYLDEKTGNNYLFFNIADSIFTSRYNINDMSFSMPYFSGMVCERNSLRNTIGGAVQIPFGEDFIINNNGDKSIIINYGVRDNFPQLLKSDSKAIISMEFDKFTGLFKNEQIMEVLIPQSNLFRKCISSNDSILYFSFEYP